jgi:hypothetical protein
MKHFTRYATGIERMQYDFDYANSPKHNHNQKITLMAYKGMIKPDSSVSVRHQSKCGIMVSALLYCDCDPIITEKLKGKI